MKIIGLTGGIGSGKSTLLAWLRSNGIPCFESDIVGKQLLNGRLKQDVIDCFGPELYPNDVLNTKKMAQLVFQDKEALEKLNNLVHPAVGKAFKDFVENALFKEDFVDFKIPENIYLTSLNYNTGMKSAPGEKNTIIEALKLKDINNIDNNNLISINGRDTLIKFRQFY